VASLEDIEARLLTWSNIGTLTWQHLLIVVVGALIVVATAIPAGILLTRRGTGFLTPVVLSIANAGQGAPVFGVIGLVALSIGCGYWVAMYWLTIYAFLPVLANSIAGLRGVHRSLIEAARGMGMSGRQVLFGVELPLAIRGIMTGVRAAL